MPSGQVMLGTRKVLMRVWTVANRVLYNISIWYTLVLTRNPSEPRKELKSARRLLKLLKKVVTFLLKFHEHRIE